MIAGTHRPLAGRSQQDLLWPTILVGVAAAAATFALRILALVGFPNDEFVSLTRGAQVLLGEWPVRDFVEPGAPLTTLTAAAAQAIGGRTLLAEAVLVAAAFAIAAGLTVAVVRAWTGSLALAAWAASTEVAAFPRPYGYPKVLLYIAAAAAIGFYAVHPTRRRLVALAALVVIALLFRHDHGVYIGAAALTSIVVVHAADGARATARAFLTYAAAVMVLVAPYVLYVQAFEGIRAYLATGMAVSRVEAARTYQGWPDPSGLPLGDPDQLAAVLFYVFWALAAGAAAVWLRTARRRSPADAAIGAGVVVLALCANAGFLRDPMDARIPDAIVPAVLLAAWLAAGVLNHRPWHVLASAAVIVVLALGTVSAARVGRFGEQVNRARLGDGVEGIARRTRSVTAELRQRYAERQMPTDFAFALVPFYQYVQVCTPPHARLLVTGFAPEVPYYARRGFAGGMLMLYGGFDATPRDQRRMLERAERQLVPFAVVPPDRSAELNRLYPEVAAYLQQHYRLLTDVPVEGFSEPGHVYVRTDLQPRGTFGPSAWPCFR